MHGQAPGIHKIWHEVGDGLELWLAFTAAPQMAAPHMAASHMAVSHIMDTAYVIYYWSNSGVQSGNLIVQFHIFLHTLLTLTVGSIGGRGY